MNPIDSTKVKRISRRVKVGLLKTGRGQANTAVTPIAQSNGLSPCDALDEIFMDEDPLVRGEQQVRGSPRANPARITNATRSSTRQPPHQAEQDRAGPLPPP